jgi:hypothetical protein
MIDFQSTAIAKSASHRPCHSPSPGGDLSRLGSGERNLAKPKVAQQPSERARASQRRDEGELYYRGRQSALVRFLASSHVPSGHLKIAQPFLCIFAPWLATFHVVVIRDWATSLYFVLFRPGVQVQKMGNALGSEHR